MSCLLPRRNRHSVEWGLSQWTGQGHVRKTDVEPLRDSFVYSNDHVGETTMALEGEKRWRLIERVAARLSDTLARDGSRIRIDLPPQPDTRIEVDQDHVWEVRGAEFHSRSGWSPFEGMKLRGRVRRVHLRGQLVYEDGQALAPPGYGRAFISTSVPA